MAVELSALSASELPGLIRFARDWTNSFKYVSVHAPTKGLRGGSVSSVVAMLEQLPPQIETIVFHPDTVSEPTLLGPLGRRVVFENMDPRKAVGQTPASLTTFFQQLPRAGFCLDLAHAKAVDPSLRLTEALLSAYGNRLRQLHVSSLDQSGHHVPLTREDAHAFYPILGRCKKVPWIFEAPPPGRDAHAANAA
jgi:hypothetical protein